MEASNVTQATQTKPLRITVVGVGGAGCNAVDRMISVDIPDVDYLVLNTDAQALARSDAGRKICLGGPRTRGLGAGGDPASGAAAAKLSADEIARALDGSALVFLAAGMGGGTGSGAAPIVGDVARSLGALTVAVVTKPFSFEGFRRRKVAEEAVAELEKHVDTLIVVPNDKLLAFTSEKVTLDIAFRIADDVLRQGIQGISEVITRPGLINVDFADVRRIMAQGGTSLMSIAQAKGPERALEAAQSAVSNPLIATDSIGGARGILVNVVGGPDMTLHEAGQAVEYITEQASEDAEVIFGAAIDNSMGDKLQITLIATGVGAAAQPQRRPAATPMPARQAWADRPQPQRSGIPVPREFEEKLARVRDNGHDEPHRTERHLEPALAAQGLNLEIPTFLRRARGLL
ncbi:MAG: cell division protein FtsZ [Anaerolineae bacterium]|nr:cell division protein FtsZ [Anaerolineae bacterium]